jgi:hypothetical protein
MRDLLAITGASIGGAPFDHQSQNRRQSGFGRHSRSHP